MVAYFESQSQLSKCLSAAPPSFKQVYISWFIYFLCWQLINWINMQILFCGSFTCFIFSQTVVISYCELLMNFLNYEWILSSKSPSTYYWLINKLWQNGLRYNAWCRCGCLDKVTVNSVQASPCFLLQYDSCAEKVCKSCLQFSISEK